jgi:hypothetical protein
MKRIRKSILISILAAMHFILAQQGSAQVPILYEDFEGAFPGNWTTADANPTGSPAYWKDVSVLVGTPYPHGGDWSGYCAGVGYGGTTASPYYQNYMDAYMAQYVDLTGYAGATLSFWYTIPSIDTGYDSFRVYIDNTLLFQRSSVASIWNEVVIDLTPYVGGVHAIEFDFLSDNLDVAEGAYIDDILITGSLPNLAPYRPSGWSDKVVVSKTTGTSVDSTPYTTGDTLYIDWAVINNGSVAITTYFTNELYLDGVLLRTWSTAPPLNAGAITSAQDYSLGQLSAGTHTIRIKTDTGGNVTESDGGDNEYTKTIVVGTYSVSAQWEGLSKASSGDTPPDPHGAAGPMGVIQTVNTLIAYYTKAGSLIWGPVDMGTFWASVGYTGTGSDPKALYDPASGRFYVILHENISRGFLQVAVSKSSHPVSSGSGDWYFYRFDVTETSGGSNYGPDYPGFGIDSQAVYVSYNMFQLPRPLTTFKNSQVVVLNKAAIASGVGTVRQVFTTDAADAFTLQPATVVGATNPGNLAYFAESYGNTSVRIWALSDPLGAATLTSAFVSVPDNGGLGSISAAPQAGTSLTLDTVPGRAQGSAFWYNGAIWFCGTAGGSSGKAKVYYYKINANGFPSGAPTLAESGSIDGGPGVWTFLPAIAGNAQGDVCLVYAQSSAETVPMIMYTARATSAGNFASPSLLKISSSFYNGLVSPGRWGDYATVSADPTDGSFWVSHEWARSSSPNDWGTWWGRLPVITPSDTTPPSVSITNPAVATIYTNSQTITLGASASDNVGVARVEFYDGSLLKGTDASAPYAYDWSFTSTDNGPHIWTARAYDAIGNGSTSSPITLTISIDITPPAIVIVTPTNGATLTVSPAMVSGSASDPGPVTSGLNVVEVRVNGGSWQTATGTANWTRNVTLSPCPNSIEARSRDNAGNYSGIASNFVTYTPPNVAPNTPINISPANGTFGVSIIPTLQASLFSDPDCTADTHAASQWQVLSSGGGVIVADSGTDVVNKAAWTVPANRLSYGSNYEWRVRYQDSRNGWSANSATTTFTTRGPVLSSARQGTNVLLQWPSNAPGFTLQWITNVTSTNWSNATPSPTLVNAQFTVTNSATNNARFYRLKK